MSIRTGSSAIRPGKHTYGLDGCSVHAWERRGDVIQMGSYCSLGANIKFVIDGNHRTDTFSSYPFQRLFVGAPVNVWGKETPTVGHDVWIASDVVIYSGVHIGDGAVIGGNSVVTKPVPPYAIVAGNPARIVKYRFPEDVIADLLALKWWTLPEDVIHARLIPIQDDIREVVRVLKELRAVSAPE